MCNKIGNKLITSISTKNISVKQDYCVSARIFNINKVITEEIGDNF